MGSTGLPGEDEQYRAYSAVVRAMKGHPVVIRTLDVGGDKPIAGLGFAEEHNPFLGWRGARLFLDGKDATSPNRDPEMTGHIEAQLGAILRAGADGEVWLMWPMIASVEEIETLHGLLDEARARLTAQGVAFGKVRVGAMIETPGAAMVADKLAQRLDFFSIGSNDLTQYALAADRGNERISPIYQPFHPGVWRLIANVIEAGHRGSIPVARMRRIGRHGGGGAAAPWPWPRRVLDGRADPAAHQAHHPQRHARRGQGGRPSGP